MSVFRNLNIRRLLLAAFLLSALLTLFLGGISAYTIRLLNRNLSQSSTDLRTSVESELTSMEAHNKIGEMVSTILASSSLKALEASNPTDTLADLKKRTNKDFDWSVGQSVESLYSAKHNFLSASEDLDTRLDAYLGNVTKLTDQVGSTVSSVTDTTLTSAGAQQRDISAKTNDSTKSTLKELDGTTRSTLGDVVLVLQLRGKLLELNVAIQDFNDKATKAGADKIQKLLDEIGTMFTKIPENVAGPFEVVELQGLKGKLDEALTGKNGIVTLAMAGKPAPAPAADAKAPAGKAAAPQDSAKTLDASMKELDGKLLELADNTVFDGTTSLGSYLDKVKGTLSDSLNTLITTQDATSTSIQKALALGQTTSGIKESLYNLVFLVQGAVHTHSRESVERMQKQGTPLLATIEKDRAELADELTSLGQADQAEAIGKQLDALIAQARGDDGLLARTEAAVTAYEASRKANQEIETSLTKASQEISTGFRTFTDTLTGNMSDKVAEGGVWMRVQLGLVVFIVAVAVGLGLWIGSMVAKRLGSAVIQLFALSQRLSSSSASLTESSEEQAAVSSEQAASLEESSSTVEEISSMAARNSDAVREAAKISADVLNATMESTDKMSAMSKGMDELHRASDQISKIIRAIDEIAFQTNILALNAAVEAARAGEAGAGFAVVADEVRALALKCKNAAQETEQIIARNTGLTREGVTMSSSVAESLGSIRERINNLDALIKSIADASQEQSVGLEQVNRGLAETSATTQKNAALAEQGASSAQELNQEAQNLIETIDNLTRLSGIKLNGDSSHDHEALPSGRMHDSLHQPAPEHSLTFTSSELSNGHRLLDD